MIIPIFPHTPRGGMASIAIFTVTNNYIAEIINPSLQKSVDTVIIYESVTVIAAALALDPWAGGKLV